MHTNNTQRHLPRSTGHSVTGRASQTAVPVGERDTHTEREKETSPPPPIHTNPHVRTTRQIVSRVDHCSGAAWGKASVETNTHHTHNSSNNSHTRQQTMKRKAQTQTHIAHYRRKNEKNRARQHVHKKRKHASRQKSRNVQRETERQIEASKREKEKSVCEREETGRRKCGEVKNCAGK